MKTFEELEEFLTDTLENELPNFSIETLEDGRVIIFTGLAEDPDGGLVDAEEYEASQMEDSLGENEDD